MNKLNISLFILIPLLLIFGIWGFQKFRQPQTTSSLPSRQALLSRFADGKQPLLIYATQNAALASAYHQMADDIDNEVQWIDFDVKADTDVKAEDMQNRRTYILGTIKSNKWLQTLAPNLPITFEDKAFTIWKDRYDQPNDVLQLMYPNPVANTAPLFVITGNSDAAVLSQHSIEVRGDYQVLRDGKCQLFGLFDQKADTRWQFTASHHRNMAFPTKPSYQTAHYDLFRASDEITDQALKQTATMRESLFGRFAAFVGAMKPMPKIKAYLYPSFEDKGLAIGDVTCSSNGFRLPERRRARRAVVALPDTFTVHALENSNFNCDDAFADAQLLLRVQLGQPQTKALESGLAIYFLENWEHKGYAYWASRMHKAGIAPSLQNILDNEYFDQESNLINPAMAASFMAFLMEKWGKDRIRQQYLTLKPADLLPLEAEWHQYLDKQAGTFEAQIKNEQSQFPQPTSFHKGFNFAHEGYQIYNGYISQQAAESMDYLKGMGSNAIALIPYSFMRDPKKPTPFPLVHGADEESDESIIYAAITAQNKGITVMLKPQVWIPRSWPGDVEMANESDWKLFFANYESWILHYATLAEIHRIPILCAATEFGKATKGHEAEWIKIFTKIRGIYSGKLTIAAHWEGDFDNKPLWDALDLMGINTYKQLSAKDNPTDAELEAGAKEAAEMFAQVAKKFQKPIIFTEVGFTATRAPWLRPFEYADGKQPYMFDQRRCYAALFKAMYAQHLKGETWFKGFYWWKFPSYLDQGGTNDPDFTPNGKPAEGVVREWFAKPWE